MFKRYDGFVNSVPQSAIDKNLPYCPFCGEYAHWLLEKKSGFTTVTFEFMCEKCGGRLMQESVGLFSLDVLEVTDCGKKNEKDLSLHGTYHISTLRETSENLRRDRFLQENDPIYEKTEKLSEEPKRTVAVQNGIPISITPRPDRTRAKFWTAVVSIAIIAIAVIIILLIVLPNAGSNGLTYEKYARISNGMTYSQVVDILGDDGELTSSAGVSGYTLQYYSWTNASGTRVVVVGFENGRVCAKSQIGLT